MCGVDGEEFSCSSEGKTSYMAVKTPTSKSKTVRIDEEESPTSGWQRVLAPEDVPILKYGA
eukprot:4381817-Karenia_brevis.AAC.1